MAKPRSFLPELPSEITAEWLTEVTGRQIDHVEQTALGDGKGFMGDVLRLALTSTDPQTPDALVAKLPKKANRVMGEMIGVYEREIMFFREFGAELPIRAPALIFSEFDRDKGSENQREILASLDKAPPLLGGVIGFLGKLIAGAKKRRYMLLIECLDDYVAGDQLAGLDLQQAETALHDIAPLHRKYWQSSALEPHFWLLPYDIDARMRHGMFLNHVKPYQQALGADVAGHLAWLKKHGDVLTQTFCRDAPSTLLHCDLRVDNVLFNDDGCAFIDFQLVRSGPAAYDVAYFLTSALAEDVDHQSRLALVRSYHEALAIDYPVDKLVRDYERAALVVLAGMAGAGDVELGNERGRAMMETWHRRIRAAAREIDPEAALSA